MAETLADMLLRQSWLYKAEGNANVAFCSRLEGRNIILRVRKANRSSAENCYLPGQVHFGGPHAVRSDRSSGKETDVLRTLTAEHISPALPLPVEATHPLLSRLNGMFMRETMRPAHRLSSALDQERPSVLLLTDHTLLHGLFDTVCVELKPKAGCKLGPDDLACRFCMHQVGKAMGLAISASSYGDATPSGATASSFTDSLHTRKTSISHYCPLDLYSGERGRVERALWALLRSPQNNLRIFVRGNTVYSQEHLERRPDFDYTSVLAYVDSILRDSGFGSPSGPSMSAGKQSIRDDEHKPSRGNADPDCQSFQHITALLSTLSWLLCSDPLLKRLQFVQSIAGPTSAAAYSGMQAYATLARAACTDRFIPSGAGLPTRENMFQGYSADEWSSAAPSIASWLQSGVQLTEECQQAVDMLERVLTAATFKDCSLMIALARDGGDEHSGCRDSLVSDTDATIALPTAVRHRVRIPSDAHGSNSADHMIASIAVVDLDPKPLARVPLYWLQEQRIADLYAREGAGRLLAEGKQCSLTHLPC